MDKTEFSHGLRHAGSVLARHGRAESELQLLQDAAAASIGMEALRALLEAAKRHYRIDLAADCAARLRPHLAGSPADSAWLDEICHGTLNYRDVVRALDTPPDAPGLTPVPDRILYVLHTALPFALSGYTTRSHGLALGLRAAGADVICMTRPGFPSDYVKGPGPHPDVPEVSTVDGIAYHHLSGPTRKGLADPAEYLRRAADALKAQIRALRPAVVMAASNHMTGLPAAIAAHEMGLPFVYEVRGFWEITRLSAKPRFAETVEFKDQVYLETLTARAARVVFTLTTPMAEELAARGVEEDRIALLPNSCDTARFAPRPRDAALARRYDIPDGVPVIGYVGSFTQYEGLDDLTRACAALHAAGRDFRLLLVGSEATRGKTRTPLSDEIRAIAAAACIGDRLILPGRVPHAEVEAHYSLIDIAPFPRTSQPVTELVSPLKPLEALAMEKAVVVSSVRAMAEMIDDGATGLVVAKDDTAALATALTRLIDDAELRARLGRAGRAWVTAERNWEATAATALTVLRDAGLLQAAAPPDRTAP